VAFRRYYNSNDPTFPDMGLSWHHSYSRSIFVNYQATPLLPTTGPVPATALGPYIDPPTACERLVDVYQYYISGWWGATGTWTNNVCVVSNSTGTIGTAIIYSSQTVALVSSPVEYDVIRDDGQVLRFTTQGGVINQPPGVTLQFALTGSDFTVTDDDGNVESYNPSGVLQSITSRAGVVQTLSYGTGGLLSGVSDSFGNALTISWDGSNRISSVALSGGGTVQYAYDGSDRLSTVTHADSTTTSYAYGNSTFPNALTGVTDESGTAYSSWTYDDEERATATQEAGGAGATSISYSEQTATVTDALGAVRTFSYTRVGDFNQVSGISGSPCPTCSEGPSTTYDQYGWVSSRADYNGNMTCYANDPTSGLEVARVEGLSSYGSCPSPLSSYTPGSGQRMVTTAWNYSYRTPTLITEANHTTGFTYDSNGNTLTKTITDTTVSPNVSRTWTYTYNSYGRVLTVDGPRTDVSDVTTYTYYGCDTGAQCGRIDTITDAAAHVTTYNTYNAYGEPLTITDPNGVVTTLTYDARQHVTSRQVGSETTSFSYLPTGLLQKVTLPDSSYLQYTYDGAHRLTQIADSAGNKIVYTLDALGNRTAENTYDPSNTLHRTHTRVFNTLSQLYQDVNAAGTSDVTTTYSYDDNGNQTSAAAPLSRTTSTTYDALNRVDYVEDPNYGFTYFTYDATDDLTYVEDPLGHTTSYAYNGFGDLTSQVSPDTGTTSKTYYPGGNLKSSTDARGAISTYTYDVLNRPTSVAYKIGTSTDQTIAFTYDAGTYGKGRLTGASDASHSMAWTYDALGRVTGKGQTVGSITLSIGYGYSAGDLAAITTPSGQTIAYGYNSNHQITSITLNGSTTLLNTVTYEPLGPVNGWTWGNSTTVGRSYDSDGRISQISAAGTKTITYDDASRISEIDDTSSGATNWTYDYDALDHIADATNGTLSSSWTYDSNGNRLSESGTNASTYTLSSGTNQISSITGALSRTYTYDAAGNALSYSSVTAAYNDRGRMKSLQNSSSTENLLYNALGQMMETSGGAAGTVLYMYDESGHLIGEYTSTGGLIEETVWLGDIPVATLMPSGSSVLVYYIETDHLNTPRQITRASDNTQMWTWFSDPFGTTAASGVSGFTYNPRFPGQIYDPQAGLQQNWNRDYDPAVGRYVESDPAGLDGGSYSPYAYVANDPMDQADPEGLYGVKAGVPSPSPALDSLLHCMEAILNIQILVTSTTDGAHQDPGHKAGTSVDIRPPATTSSDDVFCAAGNCGAAWGLNESKGQQQYKYTNGPNLHLQLMPPNRPNPRAPNAISPRCKPGICSK
jgi:RHS repeat-associated protein